MKLRLISGVVATSLLTGCGGLGFLNLAAVPVVATVGSGVAFVAGVPAAGVAAVTAASDSTNRYGTGEVQASPMVVTGEVYSYGLPLVGHYESYNEVLYGQVVRSLSDDSEIVALTLANSGATCEGQLFAPDDGWPTEFPLAMRNCLNRLARGTLSCSDGRSLVLEWRATQCQKAYGAGFDRAGGTIQFEVLETSEAAVAKANLLMAQLSPYPTLPLAGSR
jgi:hypothetical protein